MHTNRGMRRYIKAPSFQNSTVCVETTVESFDVSTLHNAYQVWSREGNKVPLTLERFEDEFDRRENMVVEKIKNLTRATSASNLEVCRTQPTNH